MTSSPHDDYDEIAPDASAMIESMRAYGYTLSTAIADIIDNSVAAGARSVWIDAFWAGEQSWLTVTDDGSGMSEGQLRDAMRLGSQSPLKERPSTDLGRFGLGLKTASLSQCRRLTVLSRQLDGPPNIRRWDLDHLARDDVLGWQLLKTMHPTSQANVARLDSLSSGTIVLWENLDRLVGDATVDDARMHRHFLQLMEQVEHHLAMVFHRYLGARAARLRILLNGQAVTAWDPFLESHPATQSTPPEPIAVAGHVEPVLVRGFVLPHKDRLGEKAHRAAAGPNGWNAQQGFYLYRNERLIVAGSWLGQGGSRPWTNEEHYKLARIRLDVPSSMDHLWQLNVKKSGATPPAILRDRLTGLAQGVRSTARGVFAHRGKYGPRRTMEPVRRAWSSRSRAGRTVYRVDRTHPLVEAAREITSGEGQQMIDAMLRVIEETVPVQQIWLDTVEQREEAGRPFEGATSPERRMILTVAYDAIRRNRDTDHQGAIDHLVAREEFSDEESRAILATLGE